MQRELSLGEQLMDFNLVLTTCPFCGTGCNFYLEATNGKITGILPCKTHPISRGKLCILGRNADKFIYHPDRLQYPLVKKDKEFVRVSWEQALRDISKRLLQIKQDYGPDAIGVLSSAKCTNEENYLIMKFARGVLGTNNIDHCARLCHSSTVAGLSESFGAGAMTNSITEIDDADCILVIGSNTTSQHPIIGSRIMVAKEKGAKLIVIDPRAIPLTQYADLFLRIKPGTNVALINGFLNVLIDKDLIDKGFIKERTEGFEELKEAVKRYTPELVSKITGVKKELIEKAAVLYGESNNSMILYAMGITQHSSGTDNVRAIANLAMITGNMGRPCTGVNPLRGQNNVQGACDMGALPNVLTGYRSVTDKEVRELFEKEWGLINIPDKPGLTVVEMTEEASKGNIKGMIIVGENPLISDPHINHVKDALSSLELLVVIDIFPTETARLAHFVLPATTFAEKDGTYTNTDRRVQRIRKAIEPIGDSKPDWQIIAELARYMGAKESFNYSSPKEIMEEIRSLTPSYRGITYERLDRGESLQWPCPSEDHPGTPFLHKDGFPRGKGRFFAMEYTPPVELPDDDYPFLLSTGRSPFHFHTGSMTRRIDILNKELSTGYIDINKEDAEKIGIRDGDIVKVVSRRGEISVRANISDEVNPGVVFIPMHFAECAANVLTDNKGLDNIAKIPSFKVCAVNIYPER